MAYNKDSGESKLRKNISQDVYARKRNKNIFKNSQTSTQPPPRQQRKTNSDWGIPDVEVDNNISNIEEFDFELDGTDPPRYEQNHPRYGQERSRYEYERQRKSESGEKQLLLSFMDIIAIIIANGFFPVIGGFIYYIILSSKGERQKAAHSIVLSAIVSFIRILFIINTI
jgi:hypothetical protein